MHCKPGSFSDSDPTPVRGSAFPGTEGRARSGASVSVPTRSCPQRSLPSHACTSGWQPVGPARERARGGATRPPLAGWLQGAWRTRANASWSRAVPVRAAGRPTAELRGAGGGARLGRGRSQAGPGPGARAGAVMPLFFAALLALLLVVLVTLFLGR